MQKSNLVVLLLVGVQLLLSAKTIHIGTGKDFPNIQAACPSILPGDTVLVHSGTYDTYQYYLGLNGSANNWITIIKAPNETVEINGGWQFTSSSYIRIEKLTFKTSAKYDNTLLHFDHAGDCNKLSHHLVIDSCAFLDVAGGNTFKLGGAADFVVTNCRFINNTSNAAGIALNESRNGVIRNCYFENIKTKGIQFKLGTFGILVYANYFKNAGIDDSALKIGESGGKEFYCPDAKDWHAKDIQVYSNIIVGGKTPFSIGLAINSELVNNTIVAPTTFVLRLLSDEAEYNNKDNKLINNLFYLDKTIYFNGTSGAKNIDFTSILFQNNLFYAAHKPNWTGPDPNGGDYDAEEIKGVQFLQNKVANPNFRDLTGGDYALSDKSPALVAGAIVQLPQLDYFGKPFKGQRCIGAIESDSIVAIVKVSSIELSPTSAQLKVGDSLQLLTKLIPTNASNQSVVWSTSDATVATVDNKGKVSAHAIGTAAITATAVDGGFQAVCNLLVTVANSLDAGIQAKPLVLSPNPVHQLLHFELPKHGDATVEVIDAAGKIVLKQENLQMIAVDGLSKGWYTLKVTQGNQNYLGRFIKN